MPSTVYQSSSNFHVIPLKSDLRKDTLIGAEVAFNDSADGGDESKLSHRVLDVNDLTDSDISLLRQALFEHSVIVFRKQQGIDPNTLPALAAIWDDKVQSHHSGEISALTATNNILSKNNASRIPRAKEVTILGQGNFDGYEGVPKLRLRHVNHLEFHDEPLSQEELDQGYTRFYRFHCDAPLYEKLPGKVTILHALKVPEAPRQKIKFENRQELELDAGATAFVSGARAFQLLTPEEQEFALNTIVQYAPRPYEWIQNCKATSDGLSIATTGLEKPVDELTPWDPEKVQAHPMVWKNPLFPDRPHLQILGMCAKSLITIDPKTKERSVIDDLAEVRRICHSFQKRSMAPSYIYAHAWRDGDLVVFHNQGVWHTITGQLGDVYDSETTDEAEIARREANKRLMWQCTMASGVAPEPFNPVLKAF